MLPLAVVCASTVLLLLGVAFWWYGRPQRHLAEAERLISENRLKEALAWLELPEATPQTREQSLLLRVRILLARRRPDAAQRLLDRVDWSDPRSAEAGFWKGRALQMSQRIPEAITWYLKASAARPDDPEIYRWLAAADFELGAPTHALSELEKLIRLKPNDSPALRSMGVIYLQMSEFGAAREAFERSLAIDPSDPSLRRELAFALLNSGDPEEAQRQLELCQGQGGGDADSAELLARCQLARGDRIGCRSTLDAAVLAAPKHAGLLALRGRLEIMERHMAEAVQWSDRSLDVDPYNPETHYQRARALRHIGQIRESDAALAKVEELNALTEERCRLTDQAARHPLDAEIRFRLGLLCTRLGNTKQAGSWYVAAVACDPSHVGARRELAALAGHPPAPVLSAPP